MNHDLISDLQKLDVEAGEVTQFGEYTIDIEYDVDADNPRELLNLGTMVCYHRAYNLGDNHEFKSIEHLIHEMSNLYPDESFEYLTDAQLERCRDAANKKNIILPLYLYDHSGITMNTTGFGCQWDSSQVGLIYISLEDVRKEYKKQRISKELRKRVHQYLTGEVEIYDHYLTGSVYGYTITKGKEQEDIDSCFGYYGLDYMIDNIKDAIEFDIKQTEMEL